MVTKASLTFLGTGVMPIFESAARPELCVLEAGVGFLIFFYTLGGINVHTQEINNTKQDLKIETAETITCKWKVKASVPAVLLNLPMVSHVI